MPDQPLSRQLSLTEARDRALECLSMTQCPYFKHEGVCDSGCYQEPVCVADQPTEGWVQAAINALAETLPTEHYTTCPACSGARCGRCDQTGFVRVASDEEQADA